MATKRIKDISTTATTFAADDFIALDASSVGTRKMAKASLITQVGANYLEKADNLSDVASKDTSKLNLEVPNVGTAANEVSVNGMLGDLAFQSSAAVTVDDLTVDGELIAAVGKPMSVNGPSMRFDGVDDEVSFAATTDSPFSFTNGTDDTPFAITCWAKMTDATSFVFVSKQQSAREYVFRTDSVDKLLLNLSDGSNIPEAAVNTSLTEYENQWVHLCVTYSGAGPNSSRAFSDAASGIQFYINAKLVGSTATNKASYSGMNASSDQVRIGKQSTAFSKGEIRDVKLFNKELSAAEVREVYSNGQLPNSFSESTGGADVVTDGGFENWTTTTDLTNWSEGSAVSVAQSTDKISGTYSVKLTGGGDIGSSGNNWLSQAGVVFNANKKYRLSGRVKRFSGSTNTLQFGAQYYKIIQFNGTNFFPASTSSLLPFIGAVTSKSLGNGWYSFSIDFTTTVANTLSLGVNGSTDPYLLDDVGVTQIGSVLDARAEQFDTSTGKLYDLSGNGFVGTQSGGVSLLGRKFPVYETGTWTPSITFGGGSTGITYTAADGYYTRVGDICFVRGAMVLSSKGSDTGMWKINNLPYDSTSAGINSSFAQVYLTTAAGLTSLPFGLVDDGGNGITLFDNGATGATVLTDANAQNTTTIRFSATYQIQ